MYFWEQTEMIEADSSEALRKTCQYELKTESTYGSANPKENAESDPVLTGCLPVEPPPTSFESTEKHWIVPPEFATDCIASLRTQVWARNDGAQVTSAISAQPPIPCGDASGSSNEKYSLVSLACFLRTRSTEDQDRLSRCGAIEVVCSKGKLRGG